MRGPPVHEFAVCQSLLQQVEKLARAHGARSVSRIRVQLGPLAGIEAALLQQTFTLARLGTVAAAAALELETPPIRVRCRRCGGDSEARPNRLLCGVCGDWHTDLLSGDEMLLASLDLEVENDDV